MAVIVEARNVRVDYGDFTALREFNLTLSGGDLLGLIGPNGAGKTTALRALAGLQPLTTGEVRVLDQRLEPGATEALSRIGFTPDTPALYDNLRVIDYLSFIGRAYRLDARLLEERIGFWLDQLWLADRRESKIQSLSRGMRQRLNVARTLLPDPSLILLDEPAAGLDPAGRIQFRRLLASLRDQQRALIVSSHILADLHEFCTHIGIMEQGRMRSLGSVAAVVGGLEDHRCRYDGTLVNPPFDAAARMSALAGVTAVRVDGQSFSLEYDARPESAAALLRALIEHGLVVASFAPVKGDLEQAYLRAGIRQVD